MLLKTYKTDVDEIVIKFTDQNETPLEVENKINLTFLVNNQKGQDALQNQYPENKKLLNIFKLLNHPTSSKFVTKHGWM